MFVKCSVSLSASLPFWLLCFVGLWSIGFALPESKADRKSPLQRVLEVLAEEADWVVPVVVICQGSTFMNMERRRVYIVFFDGRKAPDAPALFKLLLKEVHSARALKPRITASQVNLPDEDPEVQQWIDRADKRVCKAAM